MLEGVEPFVRSTGGHSLGLITNRDYNVPFYEKMATNNVVIRF
ncbi:MAG: hypothetical protein ACLUAO_01250 [Streptococcus sp.]